jgi:threonine/homoserine/homoserine lactone efflux protein
MIDPPTFLLFLGGALLLNVTPGPDMAFTLASAVKNGTRAGVAAALGISAGSLVWAIMTSLGLAALLASSQHALTVLRIAGGLYLFYLAVQTYRRRGEPLDAKGAQNVMSAFRSGLLTNLLNPKVGIFFLAFLPAFLDPAAGPVWAQSLTLGAVFSLSGLLVLCVVAHGAGRVRDRFAASPNWLRRIRTGAAAVFASLGLGLLLSRQP